MVGSALARMVLSIAPMNTGSIAPMTNSRRSLWVSGLGRGGRGVHAALLRLRAPDCSGFSSIRMMADQRHRHGRRGREEHPPVGFRRHRRVLRQRAAELAGAAGR